MIPSFINPNQPVEEQRAAFLDEAIEFYKHNPRGKNELGESVYQYQNSRCIIGRWLNLDREDLSKNPSVAWLYYQYQDELDSPIPEWLFDLGVDFLANVQVLHDAEHYWSANSYSGNNLTDAGQIHINSIKSKFCSVLTEKQFAAV